MSETPQTPLMLLDVDYEEFSYPVATTAEERQGFCDGYVLRRHKHEVLEYDGIREAREDWQRCVGPFRKDIYGSANPYHGGWMSLNMPYTKPERLHLISYLGEYLFIHDDGVDNAETIPDNEIGGGKAGAKKLLQDAFQSLLAMDALPAQRILETVHSWFRGQSHPTVDGPYATIEDYLAFRYYDVAAEIVDAIMTFGMGLLMTEEDLGKTRDIAFLAYASATLQNDYFSFDKEYQQYLLSEERKPMKNAVFLYMQWQALDFEQAKEMVKTATRQHEAEFLARKKSFLESDPPPSDKLRLYFEGVTQMVVGNLVWSTTCPRYDLSRRYDINADVERRFLGGPAPSVEEVQEACKERSARKHDSGMMITDQDGGIVSVGVVTEQSNPTDSKDAIDAKTLSRPSTAAPVSGPTWKEIVTTPIPHDTLNADLTQQPYDWCASSPSKNIRGALIAALQTWLQVPPSIATRIDDITNQLHNASLLLDDIQDSSRLRRGRPAAHTIYGVPATINSANAAIFAAAEHVRLLPSPPLDTFATLLHRLFTGQAHDLHWSRHATCPSMPAYLSMIDAKTGALFQILAELMLAHATTTTTTTTIAALQPRLERLMMLVGRLFQIRDDYQNLRDDDAARRGPCHDLDEGAFSFPLVDACHNAAGSDAGAVDALRNLLASRKDWGTLSEEMKTVALEQLEACGAFARARETCRVLGEEIEGQIAILEEQMGCENCGLRLLVEKLVVREV